MRPSLLSVPILLAGFAACGGEASDRPAATPTPRFESRVSGEEGTIASSSFVLESPAFRSGEQIGTRFSGDGTNVSPPLSWDRVPERTLSFALECVDPDAPRGEFTHWLLWNIPGNRRSLDEGATVGIAGRNDFGKLGWGGPLPPAGNGPHRYVFRLYALDVPNLDLPEGASRADLEGAVTGHVLSESKTMGTYERR